MAESVKKRNKCVSVIIFALLLSLFMIINFNAMQIPKKNMLFDIKISDVKEISLSIDFLGKQTTLVRRSDIERVVEILNEFKPQESTELDNSNVIGAGCAYSIMILFHGKQGDGRTIWASFSQHSIEIDGICYTGEKNYFADLVKMADDNILEMN